MDAQEDLLLHRTPTARRPLLGTTVLVVEDSRFASEAIRLMCLRSGARIRRADSIETARRHLAIYRPTVLIVDLGLPDGSGLALIQSLSEAASRIDVILGTSGDPQRGAEVMAAGADGFIAKPIESLLSFQHEILRHLPADRQPPLPRVLNDEHIHPDPVAYQDDLNHIAQVLEGADGDQTLDYVTQFLGGVARSAHDHDLDAAVTHLAQLRLSGGDPAKGVAALSDMVQLRIARAGPI
ncbi:response regulator [Yoonia litorea]|uniref:Response regulator receiver protein n=1 Tax=Yoonia litorea TaxID=1123755 RepID=A0A1I6MK57_9RHOB|nr:response regulator [Yoonia litorea]SFS16008.1 response regulator receiver protein [Yoonia litorea]